MHKAGLIKGKRGNYSPGTLALKISKTKNRKSKMQGGIRREKSHEN